MLGWKDPLDSSASASARFPWITTTTTPFPLWLGKGFFCILGSRWVSSRVPSLSSFVKTPSEGLTILSRVLDVIMNSAKQWILSFFLDGWPGYSEWPDDSVSNPLVQDMIQFFHSTWDHRWFLDRFSLWSLSLFSH